jgi:hypothetical protein
VFRVGLKTNPRVGAVSTKKKGAEEKVLLLAKSGYTLQKSAPPMGVTHHKLWLI